MSDTENTPIEESEVELCPQSLSEEWVKQRKISHSRYWELSNLTDASRLGYLNGERHRWSEDEVTAMWKKAAEATDRRRDAINHMYIHVPFCKSICSFCSTSCFRFVCCSLCNAICA